MNFQTIWIPKVIWAKILSEKAGLDKHSYLKYALVAYAGLVHCLWGHWKNGLYRYLGSNHSKN